MVERHELEASPSTTHWGFHDATIPPVLTINSGDEVTVWCVSGGPDTIPQGETEFTALEEHKEILETKSKGLGPHVLTGPMFMNDVEVGDAIEVEILDIRLWQKWGWCWFRPGAGLLPERFPYRRVIHLPIDHESLTATTPWGMKIELNPFFGYFSTAPRPELGPVSSKEPGEFGGNLDCKLLTPGAKVILPVWNRGGLISIGDGHAAQGDGEVCGTAIETALTGRFRFSKSKYRNLRMPRAETGSEYIAFGLHTSLDEAARMALWELICWMKEICDTSEEDLYHLCSFVMDLKITQVVNNIVGVHAVIDKKYIDAPVPAG